MPHKFHYIYKTTNIVNNKFYIGKHSTNNLEDGYLGSGKLLNYAIKKYGKNFFKKEILEWCNENNINQREFYYVEKCCSLKECYNIAPGGQGGNTTKYFSEEENKQISLKISKAHKGKTVSLETREKMSLAKQNMSDETKKKISENCFKRNNIPHSEETKALMSEKAKIRCLSEEYRLKLSAATKGKKKKEYICPYCQKVGRGGNMKRYHFENCKEKKQ